ncbi:MAG: phosphatidylserine decarboxylase [Parachlamydiaceae bacterium]|nr:phosphatidylserine decarboxylase [Parachlamydiaceae bacterium]
MHSIKYIDRTSKKIETETVYGAQALQFLYGDSLISKTIGKPLLTLLASNRCFSLLYGLWQKLPWTTHRIAPFIENFGIDSTEFLNPVDSYTSFNDFFTRKLKAKVRPIAKGHDVAIIPADGRYLFFQKIDEAEGFIVKGKKFSLTTLLDNGDLAKRYEEGSMVIARLCPTDYHRFHFPMDCTPEKTHLINGWLYSVNPIALKKNIEIFVQNKRTITPLTTAEFGKVLFIEIGATNVGSIIQTYPPDKLCKKGDEKGYFSFGASSLILLFEKGQIQFDEDLLSATSQNMEVKCLFGQPLGLHPR